MLNIQIRPVTKWPGKENINPKWSPFRVGYKQTLQLLESELEKIDAVMSSLVIEMWVDHRDIRQDGQLRANARVQKPGIIFAFTRKTNKRYDVSRGGYVYTPQQLSYPCDAFTDWKDNLRAIALSLEALRKVERYGVFKYDEIVSRLALPSAEGSVSTKDSAAAFVAKHSGVEAKEILFSPTALSTAFRKAAQILHPDNGGNNDEFIKLQEARKVLTGVSQ